MKTLTFTEREEWLQARAGKITGTRLKDIIVKRGTGHKLGFYELIAERIAIPEDGEDPMERGARLESEAIERFVSETKKKVNTDLILWERDDNPNIAISPDGIIGKTEAVEIKCLSSARHIEAYLTHEIPDEYEYQTLQYFIVNDKLKTLYVCFYDPRVKLKEFFYIELHRKDLEEQIDVISLYERETLKEVDSIVSTLTGF
ncbi:MAG: YqaJ viral recombinase family protein [Patescibacteria group bacterium]|nr:YqaJ viral recombinase family protein [Patescibacteria group bacterium]